MNHFIRTLCLGALLSAPALFAAETSFVGKVSFTMTSAKGKPVVMNQTIKGTAVRTDMEGLPGGMIMDFSKKEMIMLMDEQRMYMVHPIKPSDIPQDIKDKAAAADPDVEVTGKTETILGYQCNQIIVKDGKTVTEMWVAEGLGMFAGMGSPGGGGGMFGGKRDAAVSAKWERALKGKGGFPLRVISRNPAGKETFKMEATKIAKGGVSDADFLPPKDYQKFQMPDMGGLNPFK